MLKLSRALRVVALSALVLGAVLQPSFSEDAVDADVAVADAKAALAKAADAVIEAETAAKEAAEAAAAAVAGNGAGVGADEPGVDVAAAPIAEVPVAADPVAAAPKAAAPVVAAPKKATAAAPKAAMKDGGDAGGGAGDGLYFFVKKEGPPRCFVISQGRGSVFHVHYDFPAAEQDAQVMLDLRYLPLQGPRRKRLDQKPSLHKVITERHGSYQFKIITGGSHSLCATTDSSHGTRGLRLYLDLDTGMEDNVYDNLQEKFDLDDMQISMIHLKNRAKDLLREADFVKEMETDYHKNVIQLNREVLWWPISQVVMLLIMGFLQVRHLKKFFKNKRLV